MASHTLDPEQGVRLLPQPGVRGFKVQDDCKENESAAFSEFQVQGGSGADTEEDFERHQWSSKREYMLSAIGFCVGVGNIWRFPYMCTRNGGGAFLIPFVLSLIVIGMPLMFLEMSLGQFTGRSTVHSLSVCPLAKGVGYAMAVLSLVAFWYYNTIQGWALYYLVMSCQTTLPWSLCGQWWNTPSCTDFSTAFKSGHGNHDNTSVLAANASSDWYNATNVIAGAVMLNMTSAPTNMTEVKQVSSAEEFWQHNVLRVSGGLHEPGELVWYLVVALGAATLFLFLALVKGVKSSGKVVYVTAIAPYVVLTILLVRGATLPGALDGILFYLTPDFSRLLDPQVWVEAVLQVFYSLGPAWGGIPTMSSYNKFNNNCLRDSIILTFVCEGTSIFGGFAIFAVLGYMARETGLAIDKVVSSGPGLAFIVYPEAISRLPIPQLWAVLFFIMIFTLCCDSLLANGECVLTVLIDRYPRTLTRHRMLVSAIFCVVCFLLGLPFVTQGGIYIFQLVDWFIATLSVLLISLLQCIVIAWVYGADRFGADIEMMLGRRPPMYMKILWCFVTPLVLLVLLVVTLMEYRTPTYGDYHYDVWGNVFGWTVALVSFIPIPLVAMQQLYKAKGSLLQRLRKTTQPDENWGPPGLKERILYRKEAAQRPPRQHWTDIIRR
ncbi:sodium- and chloride-dependent glycine transporter 2-like [Littorina saxatilis]|uniref:sodium- and chloride-dependent glycine transporter 2-like n=1 Tax=Littorina saxatilis TaxID=31220 RepID=UPI0038B56D2A